MDNKKTEIYDFTVKDSFGNDVSLDEYKGKVLLIVNTATHCGFTPQYNALSDIHKKYREKGFEVLDFPCNQFLGQAPESDSEIADICRLRYKAEFKTFAKIKVNGAKADPLYAFLREGGGNSDLSGRIKWNFVKFLIGRDGEIKGRYASSVKPEEIVGDIEKLL